MRMYSTWHKTQLEELNLYSNRYTAHELQSFKGGPISLEAAKRKYPNAKIHNINEDEIRFCFRTTSFTGKKSEKEKWDEFLFVIDQYVVAYVDLNKYFFSEKKHDYTLGFVPIFTIFWYDLELSNQPVTEQTEKEIIKLFIGLYKSSMNIAESIRNSMVLVYPEKTYTYIPKQPLSQFKYLCIEKLIPRRIGRAKTEAIYNDEKMISQIHVEINIEISAEELREKILKHKIENKKPSSTPVTIPAQFFTNFPEKGRYDQEIPITVLQKNFPRRYDLLFTLLFYVNSLKWLYKLSETTTGLSGSREVNEIHILLLEFNDVICHRTNRVINQSTYHYIYLYGMEFATEQKFVECLDTIIPYQTIYVVKINRENGSPLYQIWSGRKSVTIKGAKVKNYVHTNWLSEKELLRRPLKFNGKSLSEVFSNFINNIAGIDDEKINTILMKSYTDTTSVKKQDNTTGSLTAPATEVPLDSSPRDEYSKSSLLTYSRIAKKMKDVLLEHCQEDRFEFVISKYYYTEVLENFKKIRARVYPIDTEIVFDVRRKTGSFSKNPTVYEVELATCRELAKSLNQYYDYTATNESITFIKKEIAFTKAGLSSTIDSFFRLPSAPKGRKSHRPKKKKN